MILDCVAKVRKEVESTKKTAFFLLNRVSFFGIEYKIKYKRRVQKNGRRCALLC
jgi:hypothetical protein